MQVIDAVGYPVSDKVVQFETSLGDIQPLNVWTDEDGYAVTHLHDEGIYGTAWIDITCEHDDSYIVITILEMEERKGD